MRWDYAVRVVRPLARRRRMIARPARVRIRARKPCLRFRLRLFGWYVRFMLVLEFRRSAECDRSWAAAVATMRSGGEAAAAPAWRTQRTVIVHRQLGVPPARWADQRSRCNDDRVVCVAVKCRNGPNPPQPRSPRRTRRGPPHDHLEPQETCCGCPEREPILRPRVRSAHQTRTIARLRTGPPDTATRRGSQVRHVGPASPLPWCTTLANDRSSRRARRWEAIDNGTRPQLWIAMWTTARWSVAIM